MRITSASQDIDEEIAQKVVSDVIELEKAIEAQDKRTERDKTMDELIDSMDKGHTVQFELRNHPWMPKEDGVQTGWGVYFKDRKRWGEL